MSLLRLRSTLFKASRHTFPGRVCNSVSARLFSGQSEGKKQLLPQTADGLYVDYSLPATFDKVLIANRGEIACRVIRTCKHLGIKTVAVHSDADVDAMHVHMADEAYNIGPAPANESYLLGDKIIEVALKAGAQAIHPGYGFLSETASFALACEDKGVAWIGPPSNAIEDMGSKSASKKIMIDAGVPVVPGYHGDAQDLPTLKKEADAIGFPIMIKAVLGGGGKGMRIVETAEEFEEKLDACRREAKKSFDDDRVLLERFVRDPRHVEFQVFADKHDNIVHFWERDCSVQRRHQKVLEEAPAPGMTPELRATMGEAAVGAARAVGYHGAGTVEFIVEKGTDNFFFMEMNTRLQVEHPVTEMIMARDLVQLQLQVAAGNKLPVAQEDVEATARLGHSIEARIYAENPSKGFLPCTGSLDYLNTPENSKNVRVETGVETGDEVSIFYDPMIAKLVVWGEDRDQALDKLDVALSQYNIVGLPTNVQFVRACANHPEFRKGQVTTAFIDENADDVFPVSFPEPVPTDAHFLPTAMAISATLMAEQQALDEVTADQQDFHSPWNINSNFRSGLPNTRKVTLKRLFYEAEEEAEVDIPVSITYDPEVSSEVEAVTDFKLNIAGKSVDISILEADADEYSITAFVNGKETTATVVMEEDSDNVDVFMDYDVNAKFDRNTLDASHTQFRFAAKHYGDNDLQGAGAVAPMSGQIVKVMCAVGDEVKKGDHLVIMQAMKMEHIIKAGSDGVITAVDLAEGQFVEGGQTLVTIPVEQEE